MYRLLSSVFDVLIFVMIHVMIFSHPSDFQTHSCAKDLFSVAALEILVSTPRALHHCKLHWTALTILSVVKT